MPSIATVLKALVAVAPLVSAIPADYVRRQAQPTVSTPPTITEKAEAASSSPASAAAAAATPAAAAGKLTDVDILNL